MRAVESHSFRGSAGSAAASKQARAAVIAMLQDMARTGTQPIVKLE
jgi:hypothetical protein